MTDIATGRRAITREWAGVCRVLDDADEQVWARPTRCGGWTVTDLVSHMCWGTTLEADGLRRARTDEGGDTTGTHPTTTRPDQLVAVLKAAVRALGAELDALDLDPHDRPVPMPYATMPLEVALTVFTMEAGIHHSDLRAALGADDRLEPDICRASLDFLRDFGGFLAQQGTSSLGDDATIALKGSSTVRFGQRADGTWVTDSSDDATATISGDDSDLVLFAFGRRPLDAVEVHGRRDLASRFKQVVPGP
jgi:uncharacterized protein (TIGR03083 family)